MTTKEKEIFTTEEAAEMMGCSPSTIEEHARNRVLPGLRMGHDQRAVIGNHSFQGADFISVLLSSSCEFFRLAISFSV